MLITSYPDFNRLADRDTSQQFKLVWDVLKKLSGEVNAIAVPDIAALQSALKVLQQTVAKDERQAAALAAELAALAAAVAGKLPRAYAVLFAVGISVAAAETDMTADGYAVTIPPIPTLGAGFRVTMGGGLVSSTSTKTIKLYLNGVATTLLVTAANIATNRWYAVIEVIRSAANAARLSGILTHGATYGAAPTLLHWGGLAVAGLDWDAAAGQVLRLGFQGTTTGDIAITHWAVEPIQ